MTCFRDPLKDSTMLTPVNLNTRPAPGGFISSSAPEQTITADDILKQMQSLLPKGPVVAVMISRETRLSDHMSTLPKTPDGLPSTFRGIPIDYHQAIPEDVAVITHDNLVQEVIALKDSALPAAGTLLRVYLMAGLTTEDLKRRCAEHKEAADAGEQP